MKVSIQIVTWNSLRYIFDCLESLMRQSFRDFSVLIIDNASDDGTVEFIRANYPTVSVLQNFRNLGYARANNQGIQLSTANYVLVMNPDVVLAEDFLEKIVSFAESKPHGGSFGGKILKLRSQAIDEKDEAGLRQMIKSEIIDAAGLAIFKSRQAINRGENEADQNQYERRQEVFGLTGACVLYRRSALLDIAIKNEFFDSDFFAYKEDIDLAWRLRLYGWENWYQPAAVSYHYRQMSAPEVINFKNKFLSRQRSSKILRRFSWRNHHLMLAKNDFFGNLILALPWFLVREIKIILYFLIFEPFQFKNFIEFFRLLPLALIKRKVIMAHRKVEAKGMRQWFK